MPSSARNGRRGNEMHATTVNRMGISICIYIEDVTSWMLSARNKSRRSLLQKRVFSDKAPAAAAASDARGHSRVASCRSASLFYLCHFYIFHPPSDLAKLSCYSFRTSIKYCNFYHKKIIRIYYLRKFHVSTK